MPSSDASTSGGKGSPTLRWVDKTCLAGPLKQAGWPGRWFDTGRCVDLACLITQKLHPIVSLRSIVVRAWLLSCDLPPAHHM